MYGLCALNKVFLLLGLFFSSVCWANVQKATISSQGALVYTEAHYNAEIMTTLPRGGVYYISTKNKGPFYRIRIKKGVMGWISREDLRLGEVSKEELSKQEELNKQAELTKESSPDRENLPFYGLRHWGFSLDYLNYHEQTMGQKRSAWMPFAGVKWSGTETLMSGPIYIESNILVGGAPSYYQDEPGVSAQGFILIADFLFQTVAPRGKGAYTFYGLGPVLKYSHLNLKAGSQSFLAQEVGLGVVANFGVAFQMGAKWSLRLDAKYYWERERYYGAGLSLGHIF